MRGVVRDAAVGSPGAVATGAARALASNAVNPGLKGVPVNRMAWVFNGIGLLVGAAGLVLGATTRDDTWYEATEGVLFGTLAYTGEDATHEIVRMISKAAPGTTVPATTFRAQRGGGGAAPARSARRIAL